MNRYLLDTGIASAFVDGDSKVRNRARDAVARGDRVGIGLPVLGELWAGVELSARRERNTTLLKKAVSTLFLWPFDAAAAEQYGRVFANLRRIGRPMQQIDMQIAAMAFALGKTTVVSTDSDLAAVPGLDVEKLVERIATESVVDQWASYTPSAERPWTWRRVVHLHRRAGFAATWGEVERDLADGPEAAVTRVLEGGPRVDGQREDFEGIADVIGDAAVASGDPNRLKAWWLFRMLFSPDPLREKLTLLWHNHFATSNLKVRDLGLMRLQNEILREHALGRFGDLLRAVVKDPAMLFWLDADSNRKGRPNENLARELMELFTLGVNKRGRDSFSAAEDGSKLSNEIVSRKKNPDPFGHYTEQDVKEAARALTGWTVTRGEFQFRGDRHDDGEKTILGQTANFDGDRLLDLLLAHPATARRLAWRICTVLMGENVASDEALDELAAGLSEHDLDVRWAVETVLRSELFFADENIASRVKSPPEFLIGAVRALELFDRPPSTLILAEWCTRIGQDLFYPPNVGGWNEGRAWLTSRTIIARSNFAAALVAGQLRAPTDPPDLCELADSYVAENGGGENCGFFARLLLGKNLTPTDQSEILSACESIEDVQERTRHMVSLILSRPEAQLA